MKKFIDFVLGGGTILSFLWMLVAGIKLKYDTWSVPITPSMKFHAMWPPVLCLVVFVAIWQAVDKWEPPK